MGVSVGTGALVRLVGAGPAVKVNAAEPEVVAGPVAAVVAGAGGFEVTLLQGTALAGVSPGERVLAGRSRAAGTSFEEERGMERAGRGEDGKRRQSTSTS